MTRRRWKKVYPNSMQEAIRLCLDYAMHKHHRSVARVAELNGISEWVIYKWMSAGSMPTNRIAPFELACDCTFITEYIGSSAQKLLIDIPRGRPVSQDDLLDLQALLNESFGQLRRFYRDDAEAAAVIASVTDAMCALAGHRQNVTKSESPDLALFDGGDE
ncbi:hypothetical protein EZI54_03835 [Marinobacter halodurans]|uniref:XRE family transcriptional regulator n=1 Tax=Marinobacter halodurans TaxID=2528979 RepID=A0ABY1ZRN1_9GAMM|nr:hypothetical protein [Marinobacter halodurans]TBW58524.1 hypothetical protein EZI54_03835 [Marinobacter halodurans]